jgi:hypothetical protein
MISLGNNNMLDFRTLTLLFILPLSTNHHNGNNDDNNTVTTIFFFTSSFSLWDTTPTCYYIVSTCCAVTISLPFTLESRWKAWHSSLLLDWCLFTLGCAMPFLPFLPCPFDQDTVLRSLPNRPIHHHRCRFMTCLNRLPRYLPLHHHHCGSMITFPLQNVFKLIPDSSNILPGSGNFVGELTDGSCRFYTSPTRHGPVIWTIPSNVCGARRFLDSTRTVRLTIMDWPTICCRVSHDGSSYDGFPVLGFHDWSISY